ncbi:MAG: class I SAM-dependent methyltransferase [bacterium]|nr:class I SAM-dependent methyltransferase [bacterium]
MEPTSEIAEVTLAEPFGADEIATAARFGICTAPRDPELCQFVANGRDLALVMPVAEGAMRLALQGRGADGHQRLRSIRRDDPLVKSVGRNRERGGNRYVIDATAGLCRDAMTLAVLGHRVVALERVPALALAAHWSVEHAGLSPRLELRTGEAVPILAALAAGDRPDVVYLDPMFGDGTDNERTAGTAGEARRRHGKNAPNRRAQVKKDLQICRRLAGPPTDTAELFAAARRTATERIVVKRHPDLEPIAPGVAFAVAGERVRFDVYLTAGSEA